MLRKILRPVLDSAGKNALICHEFGIGGMGYTFHVFATSVLVEGTLFSLDFSNYTRKLVATVS